MDRNDALNARLHDAGDAIAVDDDFAALNAVQDGVARRRKRRRVVTGVALSALLVAGGVVAVSVVGDGEPDSLSIAGVEESVPVTTESAVAAAETDETASDQSAGAPAETGATLPPTTVVASNAGVAVQSIDASATFVPVPADLRDAQLNWVVPWRAGFLASRTLIVPQALPSELPEDIAALFPQEVIDFFNGELPPTIGEATQMLSEAGLLDEVTAVLAEHPEASDIIYSQPLVAPSVDVVFSPNGIDWEPIEFAMPNGSPYARVQSTGDRLIAVVDNSAEPVDVDAVYAPTVELAVTTDLVTWTPLALPLLEPVAGVPPFARMSTFVNSLAVNESGWVASVGQFYNSDIRQLLPLLPADIVEAYESGSGGLDSGITSEGVSLYLYDEPPADEPPADERPSDEPSRPPEPRTIDLTWDELGVDPEVATSLDTSRSVLISGRWDGETTVVDGIDTFQVVGASDGFYAIAGSVSFSPDGASWVDLATPGSTTFVQTLVPLDDGVVVFGGDESGERTAFRIEGATDTWTEIEVPDLPPNLFEGYYSNGSNGQALVVDVAGNSVAEEQVVTIEVDGYTVTLTSSGSAAGARLVDASGTVILDDQFFSEAELPDFLRSDDDGFTFVDVESGEDIVTVSPEQLSAGYESQPDEDFEEYVPDLWVLATLDGERWLFEDLGLGEGDSYFGATPVAINGATLLVAVGPEWQVFDLS